MSKKEKEQTSLWLKFFNLYFVIGLILIIIYFLYNVEFTNILINFPLWHIRLNILISIFGVLGPALIVASLFTFSIETKSFINYIIDKIEKVMIEKEFLVKLNDIEKKETITKLLLPKDENYIMFNNMKNYLERYISKSMTLFDFPIKYKFSIVVDAKIVNNKVCFEETMRYRIYKGKNGFDPIIYGLCESDTDFEFISLQYIPQNDKGTFIKREDLKNPKIEEEAGYMWSIYSFDIPRTIEAEYLSVIINTKEYGCDHWQMYSYKNLFPSEGIQVTINCYDDIIIKEHLIYDNDKNYICQTSEDKKKIEISTEQWISSGNGFNVLVARK